jgi:CheY-like chemotaxis protein
MTEPFVEVHPLHFLLVEDDEDHAEIILHVLEQHHGRHTVDHVIDGEAALHYLFGDGQKRPTQQPDVILLDLKLPKIDGLEVLDRVKQDETLRMIPVVVLTTSDAETDMARAYHRHANSYVVKPVSFEGFSAMVHELSNYWGGWNKSP